VPLPIRDLARDPKRVQPVMSTLCC
jgi:hypothetical protein